MFPVQATMLRRISLQSNRISDKGATELYDALDKNGECLQLLAANPDTIFVPLYPGNILMLDLERNFMVSKSLLEKIRLRLERNCCRYLYDMIRNRRIDSGIRLSLRLNTPSCRYLTATRCCSILKSTIEAEEIRAHYQKKTTCCPRITWENCAP